MSEQSFMQQADAAVANFLGSWNVWSSMLAGVLVIFLIWPILTSKEPDLHPFILARQAQASPVRQEGQSAVYRSYDLPYGYPLRRSLGIKDPETPKWNAGRDGDLRDIWRAAVKGPVDDKGSPTGPRGKIFSILGKAKPIEQTFDEVTRAINAVGKHVNENGGKTVAVCLPNSVELLASIFASAFYDFKPILVPYGLSQAQLNFLLSQTDAEFLIAEAGSIELSSVASEVESIKHIIWVAKEVNKHLDWNEVPEGIGGKIDLSTWHDLVEDKRASPGAAQVPPLEKGTTPGPLATFAPNGKGGYQLVEYSAVNIIAGTAALRTTIARASQLTFSDTLLPTAPLTDSYTLCWVLVALISNASIALNSVAGDSVDINAAIPSTVKPTVIVAASGSISKYAARLSALETGLGGMVNNYYNRKSLTAGVFPPAKTPFALKSHPNMAAVRLIFIGQSTTDLSSTKISSTTLSNLRLALGVRIAYALTSPFVAGAVTQSSVFDYRNKGSKANVGVAVTSCEIMLTGDESRVSGETVSGKLNVTGPSVIDDKLNLNIDAEIDKDHTINLI